MLAIHIIMNAEGCWSDAVGDRLIHLGEKSPPMQIALLNNGMVSGKPSVSIRLDLPDGKIVLAETSARLFVSAAKAFEARYPDLFEDAKWNARGWAVVASGEIDMTTVGPTRRSAIVNWLVTANILVTKWHSDQDIETMWRGAHYDADVVEVTVSADV